MMWGVVAAVTVLGSQTGPNSIDVRGWLEKEVERARELPTLPGVALQWKVWDAPKGSVVTDAPGAASVKVPSAPLVSEHTVYLADRDTWRYNNTIPSMDFFADSVVSPKTAWTLSARQLRLCGSPDKDVEGQQVASLRRVFGPELGHLLYGGLDTVTRMGLTLESFDMAGGRWRAVFSKPTEQDRQQYAVEFTGRWEASAKRGFVDSATYIRQAYMPEYQGAVETYSDWSVEPELDLWLAAEMKLADAKGNVQRKINRLPAMKVAPEDWARMFTPPDMRGSDPVRGPSSFTSLVDFPSRQRKEMHEDGSERVTQLPMPEKTSTTAWLKPAGWVVLTILTGVLIVVRVKRRTTS